MKRCGLFLLAIVMIFSFSGQYDFAFRQCTVLALAEQIQQRLIIQVNISK